MGFLIAGSRSRGRYIHNSLLFGSDHVVEGVFEGLATVGCASGLPIVLCRPHVYCQIIESKATIIYEQTLLIDFPNTSKTIF